MIIDFSECSFYSYKMGDGVNLVIYHKKIHDPNCEFRLPSGKVLTSEAIAKTYSNGKYRVVYLFDQIQHYADEFTADFERGSVLRYNNKLLRGVGMSIWGDLDPRGIHGS